MKARTRAAPIIAALIATAVFAAIACGDGETPAPNCQTARKPREEKSA